MAPKKTAPKAKCKTTASKGKACASKKKCANTTYKGANSWVAHAQKYASTHRCSFREALTRARPTYRYSAQDVTVSSRPMKHADDRTNTEVAIMDAYIEAKKRPGINVRKEIDTQRFVIATDQGEGKTVKVTITSRSGSNSIYFGRRISFDGIKAALAESGIENPH